MGPLTKTQAEFSIQCMAEWLRIKRQFEHPEDQNAEYPVHADRHHDYRPTEADVVHSSLLQRLLRGEKALLKPPPRSFSYPNYELGEGKEVELFEPVSEYEELVSIDQCGSFTWHDKDRLILKYTPTGDLYQLRVEDREPEDYLNFAGHIHKKREFLKKIV